MSYYSQCNGDIFLTFKKPLSKKIIDFIHNNNEAHEDCDHQCEDIPEFKGIERYKFFPYFYLDLETEIGVEGPLSIGISGPEESSQLYQLDDYQIVLQEIFLSQEIEDSKGIMTILGEDGEGYALRFHKTKGFQEGKTTFIFDED